MVQYNNETVSIITPVYNVSRFIDRTLASVLQQSYKDYEIILVDDCSKDNSAEIIARYTAKYPNVIYHKQEINQGAAVARKKLWNWLKVDMSPSWIVMIYGVRVSWKNSLPS